MDKQFMMFNNLNEFTEHIESIDQEKVTSFEGIDTTSINTENMSRAERRRIEKSFRKVMKKKTITTI